MSSSASSSALVLNEVFAELDPLHAKYGAFDQHLLPAWIARYPEAARNQVVGALYQAAFNAGTLRAGNQAPGGVRARARDQSPGSWRATSGGSPLLVTEDADRLECKLDELDAYATGGELAPNTVLTPAEIAAARLARVSQSFPHDSARRAGAGTRPGAGRLRRSSNWWSPWPSRAWASAGSTSTRLTPTMPWVETAGARR